MEMESLAVFEGDVPVIDPGLAGRKRAEPGEMDLGIERRPLEILLEPDKNLAVQAAPVLSGAGLELRVQIVRDVLQRQRGHWVLLGTIMVPFYTLTPDRTYDDAA